MNSFAEEWPHRPLCATDPSEIRVVTLQLGEWDDPVVCTLQHVSLNDDPAYNAVSYVWGDPVAVHDIILDGVSYPVAANLYQVLHRLRDYNRWYPGDNDSPRPLVLWIDALCINQTDNIERSAQVQMMTQIYTKATKVFACVGEIEPCEEEVVEKLFSIPWEPLKRDEYKEEHGAESLEDETQSEHSSTGPSNWFPWRELAGRVEGDASELRECIVGLCGEDFFSRIWIVQEITLGRHLETTVLYGPHPINSGLLLELVMALRYDHVHDGRQFIDICKLTGNAFAMLSGSYNYVRPSEMTISDLVQHLLELVRDTQHFHATEPRDKIYALLGLVNKDLLPASLQPAYDKPIGKVYEAWTRFLLEHTGDLNIIDTSFVQDPDLPTWASTLAIGTDRTTKPADPSNVRFSEDGKILHAKGRLISFVLGAYSPPSSSQTSKTKSSNNLANRRSQFLPQALEMETTLIRHIRTDSNHGPQRIPYLFDLMMRQCNRDFERREGDEKLMDTVTGVYEHLVTHGDIPEVFDKDVLQSLQCILDSKDWVALSERTVYPVMARQGQVRRGDEVYLLEGSSGLTILRRNMEKEMFERVGYCEVGIEHEPWSGLEDDVSTELHTEHEGRATFRPQVGVVEIPIV